MPKWVVIACAILMARPCFASSASEPCAEWLTLSTKVDSRRHSSMECLKSSSSEALRTALQNLAYGDIQGDARAPVMAKEISKQLRLRDAMAPSDWRALVRILSVNWDFEALARLRRDVGGHRWLEGQNFPERVRLLEGQSGPEVFILDSANSALVQWPVTSRDTWPIIVVFSPTCNPCRRAVRDIEVDTRLLRFFSSCSVWISAMDQSFDSANFERWNREHPRMKGHIVRNWESWGLSYPRFTPSIYIRHGDSTLRLDGWPKEGRQTEVLAALAKLDHPCLR